MRRILLIAKRDYLASIRTKAFVIGLIVAPIMFGGGFLGLAVLKKHPDLADRRMAILDHTGKAAAFIIEAASEKSAKDLYDKTTGEQTEPRYLFETVAPEPGRIDEQRLALSDRVRRKELFAFLEIGAAALHPATGDRADKDPANRVDYYATGGGLDQTRLWIGGPASDGIRRTRLSEAGIPSDRFSEMLAPATVQTMSLVSRDPRSGALVGAHKKSEIEEFAVPFGMMMLLCMIVLATSGPILGAVADDKTQRVFEMLLGSASPFELMMGKVLGAVALALTSSVFYVGGALLVLQGMAMMGFAPLMLLPWFVIYLIADVMVLAGLGTALGAACNSPHDAQQLAILLFSPVVLPMFLLAPLVQQPNGTMATVMSLMPPFTPILMMLRQSMPGGVPAWQPWAGLAGVVLWTIAVTWAAARVFRLVILLQGKLPKIPQLLRWAVKG